MLIETVGDIAGIVLALVLLKSCIYSNAISRAYPTYRTLGLSSSLDTLLSFLRKLLLLGRLGSLLTPRPSSY